MQRKELCARHEEHPEPVKRLATFDALRSRVRFGRSFTRSRYKFSFTS